MDRGGGGELHRGRCLLLLNSYCGKALASCHGGYFFHPTFEGEVSIWGPSREAGGEPIYGQAVLGGRN